MMNLPGLFRRRPAIKDDNILRALKRADIMRLRELLVIDSSNRRDEYGNSALVLAASYAKIEVILALLEGGMDPNSTSQDGETPLMSAAGCARCDVVRVLLEHGANVNCVGYNGRTALYDSALFGNCKCLELLIENGADVEAAISGGHTVLMAACQKCGSQAVSALLSAGADPRRLNDSGANAANCINPERNPETLQLFIRLGVAPISIDKSRYPKPYGPYD